MVGISCGCSCPSVGASHVPQKSQLFSLWGVRHRRGPIDAAYLWTQQRFGLWTCSTATSDCSVPGRISKKNQYPDNPVKVVWMSWFLNKQGLDGIKGGRSWIEGLVPSCTLFCVCWCNNIEQCAMYQDDSNQSEPLSSGDTALNKICEGDASFHIICHTGTNKYGEALLKMTLLKNKERTTVCNQERGRDYFCVVFEMSLSLCAFGIFFCLCSGDLYN